ncbi:hypothetical protein PHMEG_0002900 [Phytophthora megakarya]|uniref:Uncharacterized protein n=1 Tax=Phytophthora megakarya TaxID=4795 RepID=A0A225WXJ4_9STRA|nr:hypothetical protein PHMEG_0002900 [Phytophthora megakarya]
MMAASSGFTGASQEAKASATNAEDEFGSFAAADRLSDPFGDVYGADADFGTFEGPTAAVDSSLAPPTLLPSISGEVDPFADITGGLRAARETEGRTTEPAANSGLDTSSGAGTTATSTSAILDLVWGNTKQDTEANVLSMSSSSVASASSVSRTASTPSGFSLPPPPSTKFATFPSTSTATPETSTGDLLSFSPVQASAPSDPFFGINSNTSETSAAAPAFGNDELFTLTETPPLSTTSSSAPTSLQGSFASLHEDMKPPMLSPSTPGSVEVRTSPRDPFAEHTTRSFGSLSSSFVSVGAMDDAPGQKGIHASFSALAPVTPEANGTILARSPSSAPPSLRSSFKMTDGFMGFGSAADESDEMDPFAEAGLAAPEEIPLAEALAAWSTSAEPTEQGIERGDHEKTEEEDATPKHEVSGGNPNDYIGTTSVTAERRDTLDIDQAEELPYTKADSIDAWNSVDTTAEHTDHKVLDCSVTEEPLAPVSFDITTADSEATDAFDFAPLTESIGGMNDNKNLVGMIADDGDNEIQLDDDGCDSDENDVPTRLVGQSNNIQLKAKRVCLKCVFLTRYLQPQLDDDGCDSDENDAPVTADEIGWTEQQHSVEDEEGLLEMRISDTLLTTSVTDPEDDIAGRVQSPSDVVSDEKALLSHDVFNTPAATPADFLGNVRERDVGSVPGTIKKDDQTQETETISDDFGDFGGFEATTPPTTTARIVSDPFPLGPSPSPTPVHNMLVEDDDDDFGDFVVSKPSATGEDGGFADFAHSAESRDDDDFGDFGDFEQNNGHDFTDFQQSSAKTFGDDDNDFDDFSPAIIPSPATRPEVLPTPSFSKSELSTFFNGALSTESLPAISLDQPESPKDAKDAVTIQEVSTDFVESVFRSVWDKYIAIVCATHGQSSSSSSSPLSSAPEPTETGERVCLGKKSTRASKYLKYVLSEKIQEASRQNGVFSHGSEKHQMYVDVVASGDSDRMRATLKELQDALFHNSVNDAMMRIAKQAALSAKAKIAEQAAQQQASSRGGSLFSTTRHLLSRGGGAGGAHGPSSSGNDNKADHAGADTPTGASVQKLARFSFTNSLDDSANGHHGAHNGDERRSEGSDHTGHSSGSDSEATGDSRTRSQTLSNSGSSSGGLMKKFQDRFSFASSRHRPRFVRLRRKGQSGEEVRKMELNLDSISGGLDEVKWKCAMFLYDVEEVAHVAPSQISIVAYPSKQPLAGKSDRSALTKLVKPDTIWTVDIGANNSDMLNEW